eukprot:23462-Prorocentrum_minimum.AAC.1
MLTGRAGMLKGSSDRFQDLHDSGRALVCCAGSSLFASGQIVQGLIPHERLGRQEPVEPIKRKETLMKRVKRLL